VCWLEQSRRRWRGCVRALALGTRRQGDPSSARSRPASATHFSIEISLRASVTLSDSLLACCSCWPAPADAAQPGAACAAPALPGTPAAPPRSGEPARGLARLPAAAAPAQGGGSGGCALAWAPLAARAMALVTATRLSEVRVQGRTAGSGPWGNARVAAAIMQRESLTDGGIQPSGQRPDASPQERERRRIRLHGRSGPPAPAVTSPGFGAHRRRCQHLDTRIHRDPAPEPLAGGGQAHAAGRAGQVLWARALLLTGRRQCARWHWRLLIGIAGALIRAAACLHAARRRAAPAR
jgi:hypothetical protein